MKPEEVIAEVALLRVGPCVLDKLHLPYDRASAGPAAKFGLRCELFLPDVDRGVLREQALQFQLDYQRMFPERVNEFLPEDARRTVKIAGDLEARIRKEFARHAAEEGYSTSLFGAVDIGLPKDDVDAYQANVLVKYNEYRELSFISANMPVCNDKGELNFKVLLQAVLRWCEIFRPSHGTAGFALNFASGMSQNSKYALPIMKRFPGFDFVDGIDFSAQAGTTQNRIKCVNWLTILNTEIVDELGGIESVCAELEPACKIHEYDGGAVIQAGEAPQLGDTFRNDIPEVYRMVARCTKPVRFEAYRSRLFRVPENLDKKEETLAWIRRFD
ncbi:type VI immunity family protein [Paraburkholderia sp. J67]|uniref:type VI immunity family protein n=1 Tax=Paraburkholderia sp. J67 TaxID=2805435 RepID=UPI002ABE4B50|nr:type VI immunity family protein [Paraburkholderia sp. J67]